MLNARLAFFDLNLPGAASRFHQVALTAASDGGDHTIDGRAGGAAVLWLCGVADNLQLKPSHARWVNRTRRLCPVDGGGRHNPAARRMVELLRDRVS